MKPKQFLAAALLAAFIPTTAAAKDAPHFQLCDGYERPTKKGDGMNSGSFLFGLAKQSADIRRTTYTTAPKNGVAACNKALSDPLLKPNYIERRASLMQSLAVHQMALFSYEDAMATLDEIDALDIPGDRRHYQRGTGIGNQLLRSYSLIKSERMGEAMALLDAIDALRPYSVSTLRQTDRLRFLIDDRLDYQIERLKKRAPVDPAANLSAFLLAMEFSRFDDALEFGAGLEFELPKSKGRWVIRGEESMQYRAITARAAFAGGYAYALAATGDEAGAIARLIDARNQLEIAMTPPPPRKNGRPQKKSVQRDYDRRVAQGKIGQRDLDLWAELIQLRKDAPGLDLEQLVERFRELPDKPGPATLDLISLAEGTELEIRAGLVSDLLEQAHARRTLKFELSVFNLIDLLPHPEVNENQVRFKRGGDGYFLSGNGYSRREMETEDDWTIRFTDDTATAATVEEFSMVAAAQEAHKRGYNKMLVQSSRTVQRTTNHYGPYGISYGSENSGREGQLRVRFVRSDSVPPELSGAAWRMLDVATVMTQLSDLPQRERRKRRR